MNKRRAVIACSLAVTSLIAASVYLLSGSTVAPSDGTLETPALDVAHEQYVRMLAIHAGLSHSNAVLDHVVMMHTARDGGIYKKHVRLPIPAMSSDDVWLDRALMRRMAVQDQERFMIRYANRELIP